VILDQQPNLARRRELGRLETGIEQQIFAQIHRQNPDGFAGLDQAMDCPRTAPWAGWVVPAALINDVARVALADRSAIARYIPATPP
jgi:hypothetical protein